MHAWEAIQKAVDFIEENLQEEISTETLAEIVSLSPFYFQRLFKRLVNKSVQEYIKLRRLSKAIETFNTNENRIIDVALDYGFSSHANFTRAFKETYGITPEEYKKSRPMMNTVTKPEISMNYILIDEGVPLIVGDIVLEIQRKNVTTSEKYIGFTADVNIAEQTPVGESTGIDVPGQLWVKFHKEKMALSNFIDFDIELGMSYMAEPEKGIFQYFAGAYLQNELHDTSNFIIQELPKGEYIICKIEAESFELLVKEALDKAGKYLFGTWLPKHQLTTEPFSAEKYYTNCDNGYCMEIWVKPIQENR
ncbi:AraC family transcriptional regulator [Sedimentibacter sp. MB31-C6]|uniref:AraC family transcriptional regulator n=1 Tax=Sedimentibacter sp. MB31-C6 TaxID=3109366 RepID=UPI002DDD8C0E|nr:AraC family transcriptional regulator [Sedimentibacter sp. MB36-C1]WSI04044.1 AraC family transcriptional regulator [Sedimentibacter sp. MB36-C1]